MGNKQEKGRDILLLQFSLFGRFTRMLTSIVYYVLAVWYGIGLMDWLTPDKAEQSSK
jgi:hypothetical protein